MTDNSKSAALFDRAIKVLPGGISRNAIMRKPYPFYADFGNGCRITDIEGVERIDFANNMASLIHGHNHAELNEAIKHQLDKGTAFTMGTEAEVKYAEYMIERYDSFEKIRFVNSGTEAIMAAIRASRAYTGRTKIAKAEGSYHGAYDYAEVSENSRPDNWGELEAPNNNPVVFNTPISALDEVVVFPFNDVERAINILEQNSQDLACVIIDVIPHRIGFIPADKEFVEALGAWAKKNKILLVFDEVITLRSDIGGAQSWFDVKPDLTAMGKMIGGGFPVGALAGSNEVMQVLNPLVKKTLFPHSGTFSANPLVMVAGLKAMQLFESQEVSRLNALAANLIKQISEAISIAGVPVSVTGAGSVAKIHMMGKPPNSYRDHFKTPQMKNLEHKLIEYMAANGVLMIGTCSLALSTAMTNAEIDQFSETFLSALRELKHDF
ncbi:MAG: aspartate aminotransferase family protein [Hyphomicrobiales bacterium]|nr:aspartate aminotransferase family protein [Hyphomicrobiales bacterium]